MVWRTVLLMLLQLMTSLPESPGVYCRKEDGTWVGLKRAVISRTEAGGLDMFVATGGYTDVGAETMIAGARAEIRSSNPRPEFYVKESGLPADVALIRLNSKKRNRVFRTSFGNSSFGNKAGFRKEDLQAIRVTAIGDGSVTIRPEADLAPGEYLLVIGSAANGFDFGIEGL